jgi:hypothetical protein
MLGFSCAVFEGSELVGGEVRSVGGWPDSWCGGWDRGFGWADRCCVAGLGASGVGIWGLGFQIWLVSRRIRSPFLRLVMIGEPGS